MAFYFFTEPNKIKAQTQDKVFGVVDENQFRLNNLFSSTSAVKAFAVTDGNVLVQAVIGSTTLVNLVLKPSIQPKLDLPKIDYIIYKGLKKSSLVNGADVASSGTNDLTTNIWTSYNQQVAELIGPPSPPVSPLANEVLGMQYSATETGTYKALDEDSLNLAFFHNANSLFPVSAGDHIGEFETMEFGIMIIFEKIGFDATFLLSRTLDSNLTFTALPTGATQSETFRRKHDKEATLCFMDSAAFFGAFINIGLEVFNGTTFETETGNDLYTDVVAKHFNKNRVYLDIRNEYDDSYNYYGNYDDNIKLSLDNTTTLIDQLYYQNGWPILSIDNSDFDAENTDKIIRFTVPRGDNKYPIFFIVNTYLESIGTSALPELEERFLHPNLNSDDQYETDHNFIVQKNAAGETTANYHQLKYIRKYNLPDDQLQGLSLQKQSILDNIFPIFDLKIPFVETTSVNVKMYFDGNYVDKSNINECDYLTNVGIAIDSQYTNFISFPSKYHHNEFNKNDIIPLSTGQYFNEKSFLENFNEAVAQNKISKSSFVKMDSEIEYLAFDQEETPLKNQLKNYDFDNVSLIIITNAEYQQLITIRDQEFTAPYKVYLGVADTSYLMEDSEVATINKFVLRGLKENAGVLEPVEYVTTLEVFAEDSLFNWKEEPSHFHG